MPQYQLPSPHPPIGGATVLATHPVPPVSQPTNDWFNLPSVFAQRRMRRNIPVNGPEITTGLFAGALPPLHIPYPKYQLPSPHPPIGGALVQTTDLPPVPATFKQPEMSAYQALQMKRYVPDAPRILDGATVLATHPVPPVSQPTNDWFNLPSVFAQRRMRRNIPVNGPEITTRLFAGALPPLHIPYPRQFQLPSPKTPIQFGVAPIDTDVLNTVSQPSNSSLYLPRTIAQIRMRRYIVGTGPPIFQSYEFPLLQPDIARFIDYTRYIVEVVKRFEAATIEGSFVFPVNQPDLDQFFSAIRAASAIVGAPKLFDGKGSQSYEFLLSQPELRRFLLSERGQRFLVETIKSFTGRNVTPPGSSTGAVQTANPLQLVKPIAPDRIG